MNICYYVPVLFLLAFQTSEIIQWQTPKSHNFGKISQFEAQVHEFHFQNITDAPIVIDNVRTTCGCTSPSWSYAPILPDSSTTIAVHYDAKRIGTFKKKIKVFVSGQRKAEILEVRGEVCVYNKLHNR